MRTINYYLTPLGILVFLIQGTPALGKAPGEWKEIRRENGIRVYSRHVKGNRVLEFRAETETRVGPASFEAVLRSVDENKIFTPGLEEMKILRSISQDDRYEFRRIRIAWPFHDRFIIIRVTMHRRPDKGYEVLLRSVDEPFPAPRNLVRAEMKFARILLSPSTQNPGSWGLSVDGMVDPKGFLPAFLVNFVQRDWPYSFLRKLKRQAGYFEEKHAAEPEKKGEKADPVANIGVHDVAG